MTSGETTFYCKKFPLKIGEDRVVGVVENKEWEGWGGGVLKKGSGRNRGNYTTGLTGGSNEIATRLLEWSWWRADVEKIAPVPQPV